MCLHDINLEVDLSRHNLNHPGQEQQYDGTQPPRSQTAEQKIGELEEDAPNHLDYSWTGPWPTVHFIAFLQPLENTLLLAKFWVDILGLWGVDQFDFQLIDESTMSDGEIEALAQSASNDFAPMFADLAALTVLLSIAYGAARFLAPLAEKGTTLVGKVLFAAALAAFLILWHMWIIEFCHYVIETAISTVAAGYMLVALTVSVLLVCGTVYQNAGRLPDAIYRFFGVADVIPQEFTLSSWVIFALSLLILIQVVALAVAIIFTDFLSNVAEDMGYSAAT